MLFHPALAPVKIGVLPLSKKLNEGAEKVFEELSKYYNCEYDDRGNIGKSYRRQENLALCRSGDRNMGKWNRWGRTLAAVVLAAAVVCGCGVKETRLSGRKSEREYGKADTMVIVTTERLRYEELYTDKIWDTVVDESGTTFEETLLSQIHDFLKELKTMSRMADEEKVTLSGKERELAKQAAAQYMKELKNAGESSEIDKDVVESLYEDYWKTEKLVETLTGSVNLEVSDSEAKVITVDEIVLSDKDQADEALKKVQMEGTDFMTVAKGGLEDQEIEKKISRGLRPEATKRLPTPWPQGKPAV